MNKDQVILFDITEDQMSTLYEEISMLSKKKPDGPISKFKLKFINDLISKSNTLLGKEYLPFQDFNSFDEDTLPTASDVVLILSQYLKVMDRYRYDHVDYIEGDWHWLLDNKKRGPITKRSNVQT